MYICILGRQPALSIAELEARFNAENVRPLPSAAALVETEDTASFSQCGGTIKAAKVLNVLHETAWPQIIKQLEKALPDFLHHIPEGKLKFGLSTYGFDVRPTRINAAGLQLKKTIKAAGRSIRVVPNQEAELSSAQTLHNQLTGPLGMELLLYKNGNETILAQVVYGQDIDSYSLRDRERPKRDARIGMLPPKLAQIIINLASAHAPIADEETEFLTSQTLLDPFCGTGVLLQEAVLMGFSAHGSDIDERMVRYSQANLNWLQEKMGARYPWQLEVGDATTHRWVQPINAVASETYLGTPLRELPPAAELQPILDECNQLHRAFLENIGKQLHSGIRLCLAVPAWRTKTGFKHLPVIDDLDALGYNRVDFKHVRQQDLIYHRENQIVARELLVLIRK
ncbi:MAG TPA: hypothetical protein VFZ58_02195 [Candidatus Saccharimonadales bacterium]